MQTRNGAKRPTKTVKQIFDSRFGNTLLPLYLIYWILFIIWLSFNSWFYTILKTTYKEPVLIIFMSKSANTYFILPSSYIRTCVWLRVLNWYCSTNLVLRISCPYMLGKDYHSVWLNFDVFGHMQTTLNVSGNIQFIRQFMHMVCALCSLLWFDWFYQYLSGFVS